MTKCRMLAMSSTCTNTCTKMADNKKGLVGINPLGLCMYGAGTKSRTRDLLITSQLLYQLSYAGNGCEYYG